MSEDSKVIALKEDFSKDSVESVIASTTTSSDGFKSKTKKNIRKGVEEETKRARVCLQSKESNKVWLKNTRTISTNYPICHNEWQYGSIHT